MKNGCGCGSARPDGMGEYFRAQAGMGEYFRAQAGMGEYFATASSGLGRVGEYFDEPGYPGMMEDFGAFGADELPTAVAPDPKQIAIVVGAFAMVGVALFAIFRMERMERA